jgi:heme exporter protein A
VSEISRPWAVRIRDVSKRYGRRWALVRLTVDIPVGAVVLLTGENGAGKTTLLRIIATAMSPTHGELEVLGHSTRVAVEATRRLTALMTHHSFLYDDLSAHENLLLVQRLTATPDEPARQQVLKRVGLAAHAHRPVRAFSAGMKRRLCLARMLLRQPELALLDEPFGQLDPGGVALMEEVIRELQQRGCTLIIATHDIDRGRALCNAHLELNAGRMVRSLEKIGP